MLWYDTRLKESILDGEPVFERIGPLLHECTAVVCYNDEIASRLVGHLLKHGVSIPADLAVVSFDNSQYSELSPMRITSLSHGKYNVGRMAAQLLFRLMNGEDCQSEVAPWVLVEKESS